MKICIAGAGEVGSFLAEKLAKENYEVALIDKNPVKVENLAFKYNLLALHCDATEEECLKNCKDYGLFIFLTDNDEVNLSCALLAREAFNAKRIIVRFFKPHYGKVVESLNFKGIPTVDYTVRSLNLLLTYPFALSVWEIGELLVFKVRLSTQKGLIGKTLKELSPVRSEVPFSVILLRRKGKFFLPKGETELKAGDIVYIAVDRERVLKLASLLGLDSERVKTLFVFGYSKYLPYWLETLKESPMEIKFFHPNLKVCEEISARFPNVYAFNSLLTDEETLLAEGIEGADYVWSLHESDETNIVNALFAKSLGAKRVGVLLKHPQYESFVYNWAADGYVLPKKLIASKIYSYLKGKEISQFVELEAGIDVYEMVYRGEEKPLKSLSLKGCDFVVSVERGNKTFIPTGSSLIKEGDRLWCLRLVRE